MPNVILRGSRQPGRKVSRLVLEGSPSNPIRYGDVNGEPFEATEDEIAALNTKYVLEVVGGSKPDDTEPESPSPEPEAAPEGKAEGDGDGNEEDNPEKGGVK